MPALLGFVMTEDLPLFILTGIDPGTRAAEHYSVQEGRPLQRPNEIIVGRSAADSYNLAVGDTMQLYDNRYKVVGIYETGSAMEDTGGALHLREAQRLLSRPRAVSFIFVDVEEPREVDAVVSAINRRFPEARATIASEFAENTADMQSAGAVFGALRMLAIFVGGIVVMNTMIMSIFERTREIGTLRALGWKPRRIMNQVVQESLLLCLLAALMGSVGGVLFVEALQLIPAFGEILTASWSVGTFATATAIALVLGLVGGLWPAWRASRLQPVEALRYE
jgi:ABC-type antimicrobial peptide transport system permease subunit